MTQEAQSAGQAHTFATLRKVNVNDYIEKKNNLSYLSWAFAVDQLLLHDASATWEYRFGRELVTSEGEDPVLVEVPYVRIGQTCMVFCTVKAFGVERTAQLPVMDHRNKPIPNPDSFQVNTAMQRCLAKAIALHGLGLYIYAGEDIPEEDKKPEPTMTVEQLNALKKKLGDCETVDELTEAFKALTPVEKDVMREYATALKKSLKGA